MASIKLGTEIPDLVAVSHLGAIALHDYIEGSWSVLFSVISDYDPGATTEIGMVSKLMREFNARKVKVLAFSRDPVRRHLGWIKDINDTQGCTVNFPIVSDEPGDYMRKLGMITDGGAVVSTVIVLDPTLKVQWQVAYPPTLGRNFYEVIRFLDSAMLSKLMKIGTPANWVAGQAVFVLPEVTEEEADKLYSAGVSLVDGGGDKPPCRLTPYPEVSRMQPGSRK